MVYNIFSYVIWCDAVRLLYLYDMIHWGSYSLSYKLESSNYDLYMNFQSLCAFLCSRDGEWLTSTYEIE